MPHEKIIRLWKRLTKNTDKAKKSFRKITVLNNKNPSFTHLEMENQNSLPIAESETQVKRPDIQASFVHRFGTI